LRHPAGLTSRAKSILLIRSGLIWLAAVSSSLMASDGVSEKRSETQRNLAYWADSYDALIGYKTVTPLQP
jgi:hypothetical protein